LTDWPTRAEAVEKSNRLLLGRLKPSCRWFELASASFVPMMRLRSQID
jgi:hypothetical protein